MLTACPLLLRSCLCYCLPATARPWPARYCQTMDFLLLRACLPATARLWPASRRPGVQASCMDYTATACQRYCLHSQPVGISRAYTDREPPGRALAQTVSPLAEHPACQLCLTHAAASCVSPCCQLCPTRATATAAAAACWMDQMNLGLNLLLPASVSPCYCQLCLTPLLPPLLPAGWTR